MKPNTFFFFCASETLKRVNGLWSNQCSCNAIKTFDPSLAAANATRDVTRYTRRLNCAKTTLALSKLVCFPSSKPQQTLLAKFRRPHCRTERFFVLLLCALMVFWINKLFALQQIFEFRVSYVRILWWETLFVVTLKIKFFIHEVVLVKEIYFYFFDCCQKE